MTKKDALDGWGYELVRTRASGKEIVIEKSRYAYITQIDAMTRGVRELKHALRDCGISIQPEPDSHVFVRIVPRKAPALYNYFNDVVPSTT